MINTTYVIAKNTYKEMIRDRVLYFVVVFSILFMGLCLALGQLSYREIFRLSTSLGLGGIHMCFAGLTIFLGSSVFFREIEKKTIYTLLARPVTRGQYLLGKYVGLLLVLMTMLVGFMLCFTFIEVLLGMSLFPTTYVAFIGMFFEAILLLAATFFFATFTKPFLAVTCSIAFFLTGHWVYNIKNFLKMAQSAEVGFAGRLVQKIFPDLETLNWRSYAVLKEYVPFQEAATASLIAVMWAILFFVLASYMFGRKDFE